MFIADATLSKCTCLSFIKRGELELKVLPQPAIRLQGEEELVERCLSGDSLAYKEMYQRYSKAMFNTCLRILNNVPEAEDVLQEGFIEAFKNLQGFQRRTSFGGWLIWDARRKEQEQEQLGEHLTFANIV